MMFLSLAIPTSLDLDAVVYAVGVPNVFPFLGLTNEMYRQLIAIILL
jgi:hypothetical protein